MSPNIRPYLEMSQREVVGFNEIFGFYNVPVVYMMNSLVKKILLDFHVN
jgi:hypothetical protein